MTATAAVRASLIFILCLSVLLPHLCYAGKRPRGGRRADASPERVEAASSNATDQRPRGGVRMRQTQSSTTVPDPMTSTANPHARNLKQMWAKGRLTSAEVQSLAKSAQDAGAEGLERLSRIGTDGTNAQNLFRDLKRLFGHPRGAAPVQWIELPTVRGRKDPHPMLMPHVFLQELYKHRPDVLLSRITGGSGATEMFWNGLQHSEFVANHQFLPRSHWAQIVPIGFHGDGGPFSKQDSLFSLSWNSLSISAPTMQSRFLFTTIRKSDMVADTMEQVLKVFAWSCNVMLSGQTPHTDWSGNALLGGGQDLAGGLRGALCQVRGDWEFYCQVFGFGRANQEFMCPFCKASGTVAALTWTDFTPTAPWRRTLWTHESYIAFLRHNGLAVPMLFRMAFGLRLECTMVDVLHTVDLGLTGHVCGNVIWWLVIAVNIFGLPTYARRMEACHNHYKKWCKQFHAKNKLRGKLTCERIRTDAGEWPFLKSKAAPLRDMARYCLHLMQEFGDLASADPWRKLHDSLALGVCQLLCEFYVILDSESQFMSYEARGRMPILGEQLMSMYSQLSTLAHNEYERLGHRLWKTVPKMHLFLHLCIWQAILYGNPRYYWTYGDEDLVGRLVTIAEGVHVNTLAVSIPAKSVHCVWDDMLLGDSSDEEA